jgi:hypothetical protein
MEVTVKIAGTKPLLLASIDAADPRSKAYRRMQELRAIKSKDRTDAWYDEMEKLQFSAAFYTIPEISGIAIPLENVRRSLAEAARTSRAKPKALRAISCVDLAIPVMYPGWEEHLGPEQLFEKPGFRLTKMLRSASGASPQTWPRFDGWGLSGTFALDEDVMSEREFWALADLAGRIEGVGACRRQGYGRYTVVRPRNGGAA